ncbi:LysR substrate-binding domain-containing protein [Novosphingobium sp. BL-8H]|uniref:LysR substrate-binding domain-containing protein n=1 Tax=Novosphingobium sp. BL-8H TaxID=3127640 RepID=UPI003756F1E7
MDLRQLRYFSVLAETLNFHRAAERLNMSQPPLTVSIRKLEEDLGAPLFERETRGVRLTAAGLAALGPARAALAQADMVRDAVRLGAAGLSGRLAIGFIGSAVGGVLPRIVSPFREKYPQVDLVLEEMNSVEIVRAIAGRRLDVGLVRLPVMDNSPVAMEIIERDSLYAALPSNQVPKACRSIGLAEFAHHPLIIYSPVSVLQSVIRLAFQRAGIIPRIAQEATQVQTILGLVQAGLGWALVPARTARFVPDGVTLLPLVDRIAIDMGIASAHDAGPLARNFVTTALDIQSVSEAPD